MEHQLMIVLNLGGSAAFDAARRVRECGVYCEVVPHTVSKEELLAYQPKGVILTGGYEDVAEERVKRCPGWPIAGSRCLRWEGEPPFRWKRWPAVWEKIVSMFF